MTEDEESWGREFVAKATQGEAITGCIVLHLGYDDTGKRWPGANARSILSLAVSRGYHCFLFDTTDAIGEWSQGSVTVIKNLAINQVLSVISASDILLCVDNSMFKTGIHLGKKVIPLFGFVPIHYFAAKYKFKKDVIPSAEEVFSVIDDWIEARAEASGEILGDISTFEI